MTAESLFTETPLTELDREASSDQLVISPEYTGAAETNVPDWLRIHYSEVEATGGIRVFDRSDDLIARATKHVQTLVLPPVDEEASSAFDRLAAAALDEVSEELI